MSWNLWIQKGVFSKPMFGDVRCMQGLLFVTWSQIDMDIWGLVLLD